MITVNNECRPCVETSDNDSGDCVCGIQQITQENGTLNLDLTDTDIAKYYIVFAGNNWTLNLPNIVIAGAGAFYRGLYIHAVFLNDGTITVNPHSSDSLGSNGVGISVVANVKAGESGLIWIASGAIWGGFGGSGGGSGLVAGNFAFTTTNGQLTYTLAQLIAASISGSVSNLTGKTFLVHLGGVSYISGGGDITINGSGGFDFSFNPGTSTCVIQII